jgi:hypothetical protein
LFGRGSRRRLSGRRIPPVGVSTPALQGSNTSPLSRESRFGASGILRVRGRSSENHGPPSRQWSMPSRGVPCGRPLGSGGSPAQVCARPEEHRIHGDASRRRERGERRREDGFFDEERGPCASARSGLADHRLSPKESSGRSVRPTDAGGARVGWDRSRPSPGSDVLTARRRVAHDQLLRRHRHDAGAAEAACPAANPSALGYLAAYALLGRERRLPQAAVPQGHANEDGNGRDLARTCRSADRVVRFGGPVVTLVVQLHRA